MQQHLVGLGDAGLPPEVQPRHQRQSVLNQDASRCIAGPESGLVETGDGDGDGFSDGDSDSDGDGKRDTKVTVAEANENGMVLIYICWRRHIRTKVTSKTIEPRTVSHHQI